MGLGGQEGSRNAIPKIRATAESVVAGHKEESMTKFEILNEVFVLGGARAAEKFCQERSMPALLAKIRWGKYFPQRGKFNSERACARSEASRWLASRGLLPPPVRITPQKAA